MKTGNEVAIKEWLLEAEKLIETFRETRRLFLSTRVGNLFLLFEIATLTPYKSVGFQGMFKTKRNLEENEESMASRLQIEMGEFPSTA